MGDTSASGVRANSVQLCEELEQLRIRLDRTRSESARQLALMESNCAQLQQMLVGQVRSTQTGGESRQRLSVLSPRERDVLKLIAQGRSTKELAFILKITFKTAVSHRTRMMSKLGVHETASLVKLAFAAGLVPMYD